MKTKVRLLGAIVLILIISTSSVFADSSSNDVATITTDDGVERVITGTSSIRTDDGILIKTYYFDLSDDECNDATKENIGVSPNEPTYGDSGMIVPFGTSIPELALNLKTHGQYSFSGSSNSQVLYTNWLFYGKSQYTCQFRNTGTRGYDGNVKFNVKTKTKSYLIETLAPQTGCLVTTNIPSTVKFYIRFSGSGYSFDGFIK